MTNIWMPKSFSGKCHSGWLVWILFRKFENAWEVSTLTRERSKENSMARRQVHGELMHIDASLAQSLSWKEKASFTVSLGELFTD